MSISHNNFLIHRPPDAAAADCGHRPVRCLDPGGVVPLYMAAGKQLP